jgi:hypothetical protein
MYDYRGGDHECGEEEETVFCQKLGGLGGTIYKFFISEIDVDQSATRNDRTKSHFPELISAM